jgi:hypothetical protein
MMMSVFQQDRDRYELDHLNCIAAASTPDDADLVVLAVDTQHAVLVGLDNQSAVIKPVVGGRRPPVVPRPLRHLPHDR